MRFILLFLVLLKAASQLEAKPSLYVWAKTGLTLRSGPSKQSDKRATLPYGTKVVLDFTAPDGPRDSVIVIPAVKHPQGSKNPAFIVYGKWVAVSTSMGIGYVFDAYLSNMPPFNPSKTSGLHPNESAFSIGAWLAQTAGVLETRPTEDDYTRTYQNGAVEDCQISEGSGSHRYTFPKGFRFNDGFLLLNYFEDLPISSADIKSSAGFSMETRSEYLSIKAYEGKWGIVWFAQVMIQKGKVVIKVGGGC